MKVKTSITLSRVVLDGIDRHRDEFSSRSEFMETAARGLLLRLARTDRERRDLEIINERADKLNAEAADVLAYQVPL